MTPLPAAGLAPRLGRFDNQSSAFDIESMRAPVLLLILSLTAHAADFKDPSPPIVNARKTVAPPTASAQPELTFHTAPRPLAKDAVTTDSPGFLGATHAPFSSETHLRSDLKGLPVVWETGKGTGYAPPAVAAGRLILFHRVKDEEVVDCLDPETGRRYWRFAYPSDYQDRYGYTSGPRCAPVIDTERSIVVTFGAEGKLHALDLKTGRLIWKRDILADFKLEANFFGVGSTPLLEKDLLVINVGAKNACVVGFDVETGQARWAAPAPKDWGPSYAAPLPVTVGKRRRVLVFAGGESRPATGGLLCIDPKSGTVDCSIPWRGRRYESVNASAPLVVGDKVFISECYGKGGGASAARPRCQRHLQLQNPLGERKARHPLHDRPAARRLSLRLRRPRPRQLSAGLPGPGEWGRKVAHGA